MSRPQSFRESSHNNMIALPGGRPRGSSPLEGIPGEPWRCWGGLAQCGNACEGRSSTRTAGWDSGTARRETRRTPIPTTARELERSIKISPAATSAPKCGRSSTGRAPGCGPGGAGSNPAGHPPRGPTRVGSRWTSEVRTLSRATLGRRHARHDREALLGKEPQMHHIKDELRFLSAPANGAVDSPASNTSRPGTA